MKFSESKDVELKEKYTKSMLKTVSAFSNYHDGTIYIGINDKGDVVGVPKISEEKNVIENIINTSITPKPLFDLNILQIEGKEILEITVYKGEDGPYYYRNIAYMRNDTSSTPVDGVNLTRLLLNSKNLTYDQLKVNTAKLSFDYLENKLSSILNVQKVNQAILTTLGLYNDNAYNNAALLLADNGELNQSYIDIARFKMDANTFLDRQRHENQSILAYFDNVMSYFEYQYPPYQIIDGVRRISKEQVPLIAFRETLTNAIVHRDYLLNAGVQIAMFDNRIEVVSPGGLPSGMDKEQYFKGLTSVSRNPNIANVFFRLKLIERFGTGIKRILDSYSRYKIKPSFEVKQSHIKVVLPTTNFDYEKLAKKEGIVAYLHAFPNSSRQHIEQAIQIDKSSLIRRLNELEKQGVIKKRGNGPSTVYACL